MKVYSKSELNSFYQSLTYDDISLIPMTISDIKSRTEAAIESTFLGKTLSVPALSSPMDTVSGTRMCIELRGLGCIGILNRFDSSLKEALSDEQLANALEAVSVGVTVDADIISIISERKYLVCLDTANANNREVLKKCEELKHYGLTVIVGNIAHGATLGDLVNAGADAVRVGIGSGSVCSTSVQTGIGIGQVSSILDVYFTRKEKGLSIGLIADGGISKPGDVVKALALGADVVMLGRMLAGTKETPGEIIKYSGQLWKKYRGSASFGVKMKNEFIEGEETMVPYKGQVRNTINAISDGLKSAMSYMNCQTLEELRATESFALLSNSAYLERLPKA